MRLSLAALAVLGTFLVPPAHAALTQPQGSPCAEASEDPSAGPFVLRAGPLSLVDEDTGLPHTGTVTCSYVAGYDHTKPVIASVTSDPSTGVVTLPPTLVEATLPMFEPTGLCTRLDYDGGTLYWYEPWDRNEDGHWSTDPKVRCEDRYEITDLRLQDQPYGSVVAAAATGLGEADPAVEVASTAVCAIPDVLEAGLYPCGAASWTGTLSFVRVPGRALLRTLTPYGWSCTDVHSGLVVNQGSSLVVPDPGVSCVPLPGYSATCDWLELSAYLAPTTTGRVTVTHSCGTNEVTRVLAPLQGRVVEQWSGAYVHRGVGEPHGTPPRVCSASEDTALEPSYVVVCNQFG
jgi:hypothetical protein